jgi:hypothetical protein
VPLPWTAEGFGQLMGYYTNLLAAQFEGGGTQRLWNAFKAGYNQAWGTDPSGVGIGDMAHMQEYLSANVNATRSYGAMDPSYAIGPDQWSWAPWAKADSGSLNPLTVEARAILTVETPDGQRYQIGFTHFPDLGLNQTKAELDASVTAAVQTDLDDESPTLLEQLDGKTGGVVVSVDSVMILGTS